MRRNPRYSHVKPRSLNDERSRTKQRLGLPSLRRHQSKIKPSSVFQLAPATASSPSRFSLSPPSHIRFFFFFPSSFFSLSLPISLCVRPPLCRFLAATPQAVHVFKPFSLPFFEPPFSTSSCHQRFQNVASVDSQSVNVKSLPSIRAERNRLRVSFPRKGPHRGRSYRSPHL